MSYFEKHYAQTNFQMVTAIVLYHFVMQEVKPPAEIGYFSIPMVCLYIGATRNLKNYDVKEKTVDASPATVSSSLWVALQVPLMATCCLLSIYFVTINNYDMVSTLLSTYYLGLCVYVAHQYQYEALENNLGGLQFLMTPRIFGINILEMMSIFFASHLAFMYYVEKHWLANNYFAISFSIYALEKWSMFKLWQVILAFACLVGYDVVFVYASDVMMTVATGFDAPMKLLLLHDGGYSMMGIGDIIVPGLLVSLCLRIDFVRSLLIKSLRTQGNSAE